MKILTNSFMILAGLVIIFAGCSEKNIPAQPNILVVLCDDLGYNDVGFNGSKDIVTPALDELAGNGMICTNAYVAHPFCGPSRASLMTGRYAHTIGAQFNLPPNSETTGLGIDVNEVFISQVLHNAGYYTGAIGKWHLGAVEQYHPNNRGFDDYYGFLGGGHNYFPAQYLAAYDRQKKSGKDVIFEYLQPLEHNKKEVRTNKYITDELSDEAERFVTEANEQKKPFFLYLAYNAPHVPLQAKEEDMEKFSTIKDEDRRTYAAMVYAVDRGVKNVVKKLKENGQFENTLIVFLSDNGGKLSRGANNFPLREGKGSACEGGYRVPMFFHWPRGLDGGRKFEHPVTAIDFYPTFVGLAGAKIPAGKILDGKNILSFLQNGTDPHKDEMIYCMRHRVGYTDVGACKNQYKALKINQEKWELYDVVKDPGETKNIATEHPEVLRALVNNAKDWSDSHVQPLWWHDKQTGIEWKEMKMPHFDVTFKLD